MAALGVPRMVLDVIRNLGDNLLATGGSRHFEPSGLEAELKVAWVGNTCTRRELQVERIIVEGDSCHCYRLDPGQDKVVGGASIFIRDIWRFI